MNDKFRQEPFLIFVIAYSEIGGSVANTRATKMLLVKRGLLHCSKYLSITMATDNNLVPQALSPDLPC